MAGLLFLALVFFAFGKADLNRNSTQSAADAAALAAAQDSRDQLDEDLLENILDGDYLEDLFNGNPAGTADGCGEAQVLAGLNDAVLGGCAALGGRWGFTVDVEAGQPVGASIIDGTEGMHATATATAVVEPFCTFEKAEEPEEGDPGEEPPPGEEAEVPSPGSFICEGEEIPIDPENLVDLPDMADLFTVRLDEA